MSHSLSEFIYVSSFILALVVFLLLFITNNAYTLIISGISLMVAGTAIFFIFILSAGNADTFGIGMAGLTVWILSSIVSTIVIIVGAIKSNKSSH